MNPHTNTDPAATAPHRASQAGSTGRVEVVVYRHPDLSGSDGTNVTVFLDGVRVDEPEIVLVDPGRGHELDEWRQDRELAAAQASPAAAGLIREFYDDGEETKYVG